MISNNSANSFQRKIENLNIRVEQVRLNSKEYKEKEKTFSNILRSKTEFNQKELQDSYLSYEEEVNRLIQDSTELIDIYSDLLEVICSLQLGKEMLSEEDKPFIKSIPFHFFILIEQSLFTVFESTLPDNLRNSIEEIENKIWKKFRDFPQLIEYFNDSGNEKNLIEDSINEEDKKKVVLPFSLNELVNQPYKLELEQLNQYKSIVNEKLKDNNFLQEWNRLETILDKLKYLTDISVQIIREVDDSFNQCEIMNENIRIILIATLLGYDFPLTQEELVIKDFKQRFSSWMIEDLKLNENKLIILSNLRLFLHCCLEHKKNVFLMILMNNLRDNSKSSKKINSRHKGQINPKVTASNIPKDGENLSTNTEKIPKDGENLSTNTEKIPKDGENLSTNTEKIPKDGENLSTNTEKIPKDGENLSTNTEKIPKDGENLSTNTEKIPKDGENLSTNTEKIPKDGENLSTNTEKIPKDGENLSTNTEKIPKDGENLSTNTEKIPKDGENLSTNTEKIPKDGENLSTNTEKIPKDGENLSTNTEEVSIKEVKSSIENSNEINSEIEEPTKKNEESVKDTDDVNSRESKIEDNQEKGNQEDDQVTTSREDDLKRQQLNVEDMVREEEQSIRVIKAITSESGTITQEVTGWLVQEIHALLIHWLDRFLAYFSLKMENNLLKNIIPYVVILLLTGLLFTVIYLIDRLIPDNKINVEGILSEL